MQIPLRYNVEVVNTEKHPSHIEISMQISCRDMNFSVSSRNITVVPMCTERNHALSNIKCHLQKCQAPLNVERESWKSLHSLIPLFFARHLYTHLTLKENPKPLQKSYSSSPFSMSVSLFLSCPQVHQNHFFVCFRFHICVLAYGICFSLSDLLHSV